MSRFKVRWRNAVWDADLLCEPGTARPVYWQIYGYPNAPGSGGALGNHWVSVAEAAEVRNNRFTVSSPTVNEPPPGQNALMVFTVNLTQASQNNLTLSYSTQGAGATPTLDYISTSGLLTFAPGETSKNVTVTVRGDSVSPEVGERIELEVSEPFTFDPPVSGYGTINDYPWDPNMGSPYVYNPIHAWFENVLDTVIDFVPRWWDRT